MSLLLEAPAPPVAAWPPARYTLPLTVDHDSLFHHFERPLRSAWMATNHYDLEPWQRQLLHAVTELLADGHLRYSEVVISLGRQNGKTEILGALGLLFMLAKRAPLVISIASSAEQARLVYDRASKVANGYGPLRRRFRKLTETRGLATITGGAWEIKAAKSASIHGQP
ncbi:MAG: hypothetical protein JWP75_2931, partial [Frondihabitans sp.]|nr:hypothetical protein [Frondihabitans sp.]